MFKWIKSLFEYEEYKPPTDAIGRAAENIALEMDHSGVRGGTPLTVENVIRTGVWIGVLQVMNDGREPDEEPNHD